MSRVSRFSLGSGVLDADTDNLGGETTRWWKNLEGNTLARVSIGTSAFNQTSPQLNADSEIESEYERVQWWKALDQSEEQFESVAEKYIKLDRTKEITTTSESEEEPRIVKKKYALHSKAKKTQGNEFLNILNCSVASVASEPVYRSRDSVNEPSSDDAITDIERARKNSARRSEKSTGILRLKNKVLAQGRRKNIFDDVSNKNESQTVSKSRSLRRSLFSKADRAFRDVADSPIIKQGGAYQLISSFDSEHDVSHLPGPEAQSTLLNITTSTVQTSSRNNSDTEVIRKPKPKLWKPENKDAKENIFEDILAEEEDQDEKGKSKSATKSSELHIDVSKKSISPADCFLKIPKVILTKIDAIKRNVEVRQLLNTDDSIIPSSQNVKKSIEHNKLNDFIESDSSSSTSFRFTRLQKPRSKFFNKPRRISKNIFQDALEEDDDLELFQKSKSKVTADREEDVSDKNKKSSSSEKLELHLSDSSQDVGTIKRSTRSSTLKNDNNSNAAVLETNAKDSTKRITQSSLQLLSKKSLSKTPSHNGEFQERKSIPREEIEHDVSKAHSRASIQRETSKRRTRSSIRSEREKLQGRESIPREEIEGVSNESSRTSMERETSKRRTRSSIRSEREKLQGRESILREEIEGVSNESSRTSMERETSKRRTRSSIRSEREKLQGRESIPREEIEGVSNESSRTSVERETSKRRTRSSIPGDREKSQGRESIPCEEIEGVASNESSRTSREGVNSKQRIKNSLRSINKERKRKENVSSAEHERDVPEKRRRTVTASAKTPTRRTVNSSRSLKGKESSSREENECNVLAEHKKPLEHVFSMVRDSSDEEDEHLKVVESRNASNIKEQSNNSEIKDLKGNYAKKKRSTISNVKDVADEEDDGTPKIKTRDEIISQKDFLPNRSSAISILNAATSKKIDASLSRIVEEEHKRKESVLHREDEHEALEGHSRTSSSMSRIFSTNISYSTDKDDEPTTRASSRNSNKSLEWSVHSAADTLAQNNASKIVQNLNGTLNSSEKQSNINIKFAKDISSLKTGNRHSIALQRHREPSENSGISIENTRSSGERGVSLPRSIDEGIEGKEGVLHGKDKLDVLNEHNKASNNNYLWMCSVSLDSSDDEGEHMREMKNRSVDKLQKELKDIEVEENTTNSKRQIRQSTILQKQRASRENSRISTAGAKTPQRTASTSRSVNEEMKSKGSVLHEEDVRGVSRKHSKTPMKSFTRIYCAASSSSDEEDENRSASKLQEPLGNIQEDKNISTLKRQSRHSTISQEQIALREPSKVSTEENSKTPNRRTVNSSRSVNEELRAKGSILHEEDERGISRKHSKTPMKSFTRIYSAASGSSDEGDENMEEKKSRSASKLQEPLENIQVDKNISTPKRQSRHSIVLQEQRASRENSKVSTEENSRTPNRRTANLSRSVNEERKAKESILHEEDERGVSRKHSKTPMKSFTRIYSAASSSSDEGDENMEEKKNRSASKLQEPLENIQVDKNISTPKRQSRHSTILQEQIALRETSKVFTEENSRTPNRRTVNSARSVNEELKAKGSILHEEDERGVLRKHGKTPMKSFTGTYSAASSSSDDEGEHTAKMKNRSVDKLQKELKDIEVEDNITTPKRQTRQSTISQKQRASRENSRISTAGAKTPQRTANTSRSVNDELKSKGSVLHEEDERGVLRKHSKTPMKSFTRIYSAASSNSDEEDKNRSASKLQEPLENIQVDKNISTPKRQSRYSTISQEQIALRETSKVSIENNRTPSQRTLNSSRSVNEELRAKGSILHEEDERGIPGKHSKTPMKSFTRIYSAASSNSDEEDENRSASKLQEPLENIQVDKYISTPKKQSRHSTISQEQIALREPSKVSTEENSRTPNRRTVNSSRSVNEELKAKGSILHEEDEYGVLRKHGKTPMKSFRGIYSAASGSSDDEGEHMAEMKNRSVGKLQKELKDIEVEENITTPKRQTRQSTISQKQRASRKNSRISTTGAKTPQRRTANTSRSVNEELKKKGSILHEGDERGVSRKHSKTPMKSFTPIYSAASSSSDEEDEYTKELEEEPNRRTVNLSRSVNEELKRKGDVRHEEDRDVSEARTTSPSVLSSEFSTVANVSDNEYRQSFIQEERNDASKIQDKSAKNRKSIQAEETNNVPRKQTKYSTLFEKLVSLPKDIIKSGLDKSKDSSRDLNGSKNILTATTVYQPINKGPIVRETHSKMLNKPGTSMPSTKSSTSRSKIVPKGQKNIQDFFSVGKLISASQGFANKQKKEEVTQTLVKIQKLDIVALTAGQIAARNKSPARRTRRRLRTSARNRPTDQTQNRPTKAYREYKNPRLPRPKYWVTDRLYNYLWKRLKPKYSQNSRAVSEKFVLQLADVTTLILRQKSYLKYKMVLHTLMKEMARLGIIRTVLDFYHFCQEFLPSELRFKMIPMLLPGNKTNIPFNPDSLYDPLIDEE